MTFISFLKEHVAISIWIIGAIALFSSIVAVYKNFSEICKMFRQIRNLFKKLCHLNAKLRRRKYNKVVASKEYLEWQNNILDEIYEPIIAKFNKENKNSAITCKRADCFPDTENYYRYESVYFQVNENLYPYPFKNLSNKSELKRCKVSIKKFSNKKFIDYKPANSEQKRFYRLMKPTISFPNNIGYALDEISFENGFHFTAKACTYKMNVCTSNIMEYELYKLYLKEKGQYPKDALKKLKTRNHIHEIFENNLERIFTSGDGRTALLGVQAMVLCKNNYTGSYDVLRIRRSENVDAKSDFLQFIPSGGFSALNNYIDYDTQYAEFSVAKAILRELLEECFGEEDFSGRKSNSTENIYSDKIIDKLLSNKGLIFNFIGSAFSLVNLKHELCFLLVIEDKELVNLIRKNDECSSTIQFVSIDDLERQSFWIYNAEDDNDCKLLNPTSAALLNLVINTDIYKNLKNKKQE